MFIAKHVPSVGIAAADSKAEGTTESTGLNGNDCAWGYKQNMTDPVPRIVADNLKSLFSTKQNKGDEDVCRINSVLKTETFDAKAVN